MISRDLKKGGVYFGMRYEDETCTLPLVHSYEYLGINLDASPEELANGVEMHCFRRLGSEDTLELTERELKYILDLEGVVEALRMWSKENPGLLG